jgi:hypothetical protein
MQIVINKQEISEVSMASAVTLEIFSVKKIKVHDQSVERALARFLVTKG